MTNHTPYKETLEIELAQITKDLQELGIHNPLIKEDWIATPGETMDGEPDENVLADKVEDWQERRATLSVLETRFNNINRALQKMKDGTFGTCEIGGEPIDPARLSVNPSARTCKNHMDNEAALPA